MGFLQGPFSETKMPDSYTTDRKKFLAEAGTRTRNHWVPPKLIKVCTKKWYIQGELCGLTKKIATVIFGHFSLEKHRLKIPKGIHIRLENHFSSTANSKNPILLYRKLLEKLR